MKQNMQAGNKQVKTKQTNKQKETKQATNQPTNQPTNQTKTANNCPFSSTTSGTTTWGILEDGKEPVRSSPSQPMPCRNETETVHKKVLKAKPTTTLLRVFPRAKQHMVVWLLCRRSKLNTVVKDVDDNLWKSGNGKRAVNCAVITRVTERSTENASLQ